MKRIVLLPFLTATLMLILAVGSTAAQIGPRVVAAQNIALNQLAPITSSTLPSSGSYADVRTSNLQFDNLDPLHPCRSGTPDRGSYSVFLRIIHPGGTLNISTAGSNYDTVMSVFNVVGGRASGEAVVCNDDSDGFTSAINTPVAGGEYIVMISRFDTTSAGSALNLSVNMSFSSPNIPTNDAHTAPIPLTVGVVTVQPRPHFLSDNATDLSLMANCEMYNTAWYSFTVPESGYYRFDTFGTNILWQPNYSTPTSSIAVHNTTLPSQLSCSVDYTNNAVTDTLYFVAGSSYLVRVGSSYNVNMLPGTTYSIRPIFLGGNLTRNNVGFENGGTGWTANGVVDFSGGVAKMNAGATTKSIVQARNNPPTYFKLSPKGTVYLQARYTYNGTATGTIRIRIDYKDGTPATVVNVPIASGLAQNLSVPVKLASANVKKVRVYAILNPGSGTLDVDFLYAEYRRGVFAAVRQDAGLLTLPDAPGQ
ncbi:MAG: hypothetical protein MUF38_10925 [Anaerolineae bacterium]|nr:hypothetical protein [Anaerolineae bacterium]